MVLLCQSREKGECWVCASVGEGAPLLSFGAL
ncbi:hypothetical protein E2C01_063368 [Portunus trituberculatus]|uniref:Uncharacterized protein n=1 Tax=Portunus trituberculatus TaxID=210409 RepID=A0A5B7HG65_PORTR|nr:hypothetical protein [Portunus trituberculatus]